MITITKNNLIDIIQRKTGIQKDVLGKLVMIALSEMKHLIDKEDLETSFGVFSLGDSKVVFDKKIDNRRGNWIAKSDKNYQKILETNGAWFQTVKGRNALKRSKVGVARMIRADYALEAKKLRAETGLSQKEFSELVGIAKSSLQAIEYGNAYLSDGRMSLILNRLGYDGGELSEKVLMFSNLAYPVSVVRNHLCKKLGFDFEDPDNDGIDWNLVEDAICEWKKLVRE